MDERREDVRVYVDAKIKGIHDRTLPKRAFVGYVVDQSGEHEESRVNAEESDDAEIQAILFAIERVKPKYNRMTIICDHESVVSEANKTSVRKPSPLLVVLRKTLGENPSIRIGALQFNLAHRTLTAYVNRIEADAPNDT